MGCNGGAVRRIRQHQRLSARGLAKQVGVYPSTITRLEQGITEPRPATLRGIADALAVPVTALMNSNEQAS